MRAIRLGIVGSGDPVAAGWIEVWRDHPECVVVDGVTDASGVDALVLAEPLPRAAAWRTALAASIPVVCPAPVAPTNEAWLELSKTDLVGRRAVLAVSNARLLAPMAEMRRAAVEQLHGPLVSGYIAFRGRADGPAVEQLLVDAVDYGLWCANAAPARVWATGRKNPEVICAHLVFNGNLKLTLEVGAHLPRQFAQSAEIEVDLMCRDAVLRAQPLDQAVTLINQSSGLARFSWRRPEAYSILEHLAQVLAGDAKADRSWSDDGAALQVVGAIQSSMRRGRVVELAYGG